MIPFSIDAKAGRYVIMKDIPGAFLHVDMKDTVHMILEGTLAEHIAKLEPTIYRKYIWHNKKGKPMLYVQLKWHCMVRFKWLCYSVNCCQIH